jgi:hypothetical protein
LRDAFDPITGKYDRIQRVRNCCLENAKTSGRHYRDIHTPLKTYQTSISVYFIPTGEEQNNLRFTGLLEYGRFYCGNKIRRSDAR